MSSSAAEARTALARPLSAPVSVEDIDVAITPGFRTEAGDLLPDACVRLRRHGRAGAPAVLVMGGISSGREVGGEHGWWAPFVGAGAAVDLDRHAVYGVDFAPLGDHRVRLTPRTQAELLEHARAALGLERFEAVIGASYGGMVGLAYAALAPARIERLCVISAAQAPSALGMAWRGVQRRIVEAALARGDGEGGLALARQLAMISYRSAKEFDQRFERVLGEQGTSDLDRYLITRGRAYSATMPPQRWLSLSEAIDRSVIAAERVATPTTLIASASDQIVPLDDMRALAAALPHCTSFQVLDSAFGHDAFLKETEALAGLLTAFLENDRNV